WRDHFRLGGATTAELAIAILRDPPLALPEDVPVALRHVVERCLSKEAVQRYRSAGEVRAGFEGATRHATQRGALRGSAHAESVVIRFATRFGEPRTEFRAVPGP